MLARGWEAIFQASLCSNGETKLVRPPWYIYNYAPPGWALISAVISSRSTLKSALRRRDPLYSPSTPTRMDDDSATGNANPMSGNQPGVGGSHKPSGPRPAPYAQRPHKQNRRLGPKNQKLATKNQDIPSLKSQATAANVESKNRQLGPKNQNLATKRKDIASLESQVIAANIESKNLHKSNEVELRRPEQPT